MRIGGNSPSSLLLLAAAVLFVLAAFGFDLGSVNLVPLGLAALAAAFLFGGRGRNLI